MKVLNLRCIQGHAFEGWFASEDDFQQQLGKRLVACPMCGDVEVAKLPSAPRLNLSGAREPAAPPAAKPVPAGTQATGQSAHQNANQNAGQSASQEASRATALPASDAALVPAELQALWLKAMQQVVARTEDVGERFPEEARRIHYGETEHRGIRGQATPEERAALADEGIEVVQLPMPPGLKGPLQ